MADTSGWVGSSVNNSKAAADSSAGGFLTFQAASSSRPCFAATDSLTEVNWCYAGSIFIG